MVRHRRRTVCAAVVMLLSSAGLSACGSLAPPPVTQPVALTVTPAPVANSPAIYTAYPGPSRTPRPTPTATPEPDASGYFPAPSNSGRGGVEYPFANDYAVLEEGPVGPLLAEIQSNLHARDAEALAALVDEDEVEGGVMVGAEGSHGAGTVPQREMAAVLQRLFDAGSIPVIQGYFLQHPNSRTDQPPYQIFLVTTGWRGNYEYPASLYPDVGPYSAFPDEATSPAVWELWHDGGWNWTRWLLYEPDYGGTVRDLSFQVGDMDNHANYGDKDYHATYHVVRPRTLWPTPVVESTQEIPSPDGKWVAREIVGEGQQIEPRDTGSWREYLGLQVTEVGSGQVHTPESIWQQGDPPVQHVNILGWRPNSREILFSSYAVGDGCGGASAQDYASFDVTSGQATPLDVSGWSHTLDPAGARLAYLTMPDKATGQVNIRDLDTGEVVTGTLAAESIGYGLAWSPDGQAIAFTFGSEVDQCFRADRVGIARMAAATGETTTLVQLEAMQWQIVAWRPDGIIELTGPTIDEKTPVQRRIDAATGASMP